MVDEEITRTSRREEVHGRCSGGVGKFSRDTAVLESFFSLQASVEEIPFEGSDLRRWFWVQVSFRQKLLLSQAKALSRYSPPERETRK